MESTGVDNTMGSISQKQINTTHFQDICKDAKETENTAQHQEDLHALLWSTISPPPEGYETVPRLRGPRLQALGVQGFKLMWEDQSSSSQEVTTAPDHRRSPQLYFTGGTTILAHGEGTMAPTPRTGP